MFGNRIPSAPRTCAPAVRTVDEIIFNAGRHTDAIRMRYADFARLVQPKVVESAELERVLAS